MKDKIYHNPKTNEWLLHVGKSDNREHNPHSGAEELMVFKVIKWRSILGSGYGRQNMVIGKEFVLMSPMRLKANFVEYNDLKKFQESFYGKSGIPNQSNRIKTKTELKYERENERDLKRLESMSLKSA